MERRLAHGRSGAFLRSAPGSRFVRWRAQRLAGLLRRSGEVGNAVVIASDAATKAFWAGLLAAPLAIAASVLVSPLLALVAGAPLVFLAVPELRLRDAIAHRRESAERELPFFSVFASVLGEAGVSLYAALNGAAAGGVFPQMAKEARLLRRDVEILGMNPNEAFETMASSHPSKRFSDFLTGYTSKVRSGGDVAFYLSGAGGSLLRGLENEWARYAARVGIVGSMMITVFGVVPLLLMVVGIFSPGFSTQGLVLFTALGVPLSTIALLYLTGRMQPVQETNVDGKAVRSLGMAVPVAAVGALAGQAWLAAAAFLFILFASYGLSARRHLAESLAVESGLSRFLKDLLEYKRQDYDLARAVVAIAASNKYNRHFDAVLVKVAAKLRAGVPLDEVKVECKSRLARLTFLLLGEMSRSGGGTVETVYQVSSFSERVIEMRQNAASEMKPYLALSYASPLLLAFGITFVGGVLSAFSGRLGAGLEGLRAGGVGIGSVPPTLTQVSDLLIVVSAASLGLIGAKITDFTARNTMKAAANVALAVGALSLVALFRSHSLPLAFWH